MDINTFFGDSLIEINCDNCHKDFEVKFKQVSKDGSVIQCPFCQIDITVDHDDTTKKTLKDSSKAIKDFDKGLEDLEKIFKKF